MNWTVLVFSAVLFFVLTPGILVTLPKGGNKMTVAAVHALVFGLIFYFSNKLVVHLSEGFKEGCSLGSPCTKFGGGGKGTCKKGAGAGDRYCG